jgi:hypothetical protein
MNIDKNIFLLVDELTNDETDDDELNKLLSKWDTEEIIDNNEEIMYSNYTVKELLKICKYYNIDSHIKMTKCRKQDIITNILYFEDLVENGEIVEKRRLMWHYIRELLGDPKMKHYIIWN